jgi:hypothetical protein
MAERLALGDYDQWHHFGVWDATPVETELLVQAGRLVGRADTVLVIDDTAIPKKGISMIKRKRIEEPFGWIKTTGGLRKARHRGRDLVEWFFVLTAVA